MLSRRQLLKSAAILPIGGVVNTALASGAEAADHSSYRDYFKELGVRTFINAAGPHTRLSGALMPVEVMEAINYASRQYVNLDELQDRVGKRIAELLRCEGAVVTAGASSAATLGTAGILTGLDESKVACLPNNLQGMKSEVIVQKAHRSVYDHALINCGVNLVEVVSRKDLVRAINDKTAMLWFLNNKRDEGEIHHDEFVQLGRAHGIPTFIDSANDVPPKENLWKFTELGFDLVCISGGKGLRGPQSAGLLLGRDDLIRAARLHMSPRAQTIGRGMKVNKEEVLAMLVALEHYLARDHDADWKIWERQTRFIYEWVNSIPGVNATIHVPKYESRVPKLLIKWDQKKIGMSYHEFQQQLRSGHPSIETYLPSGDNTGISVATWMLSDGQERIVAERMKDLLASALAGTAKSLAF